MKITGAANVNSSCHFIERFFRSIPLPYPLTALIFCMVIYLGYIIFINAIPKIINPSYHLVAISMGAIIGYQMAAIYSSLGIMREIITSLDELRANNESHVYSIIGNKLLRSPWRYVLMIFIILPFYLIDWGSSSLYEYFFWFHCEFKSLWAIAFDIFVDVLEFLALLLLSIIIWIICVITYLLQYAASIGRKESPHKADSQSTKIKMESIRSLLLKTLVISFISVSLAIFSYVSPYEIYSIEILMMLAILLFSLILFIFGREATHGILKNRVIYELNEINQKSREQIDKLLSISPDGGVGDKDIKVSSISEMLDVLKKEREQLEGIYPKGYNLLSFVTLAVTSIGSFLIPIAAGMLKMILEENHQVITQLNSTALEYAYNLTIQQIQYVSVIKGS